MLGQVWPIIPHGDRVFKFCTRSYRVGRIGFLKPQVTPGNLKVGGFVYLRVYGREMHPVLKAPCAVKVVSQVIPVIPTI